MKETEKNSGISHFFKNAGSAICNFFKWIGADLKDIGTTFANGDWKTRVSYLIMGFGQLMRKQYARAIAFFGLEVLFIYYMVAFGSKYLVDIATLGTHGRGFNPDGTVSYGDNSFYILLYSLLSIIAIAAFIFVWRLNVRQNRDAQALLAQGKKLPTTKQDLHSLLDENFDKTLLALPLLGIFVFTVLPIIFMICVAFTNYDYNHQPPAQLFTWVGLENFKNMFSMGTTGFGKTFGTVLSWTLVWAFFATFLNYFLGMGVAILINKKGIKFKKLWRTILVMTIAVPQFVSLLYVGKMFAADGLVNAYLLKWGWIDKAIPFWTNPTYAKILIIVINCWIGIPYLMLIATGLLMNIPEDLYESARIDGANPFQMFMKITLPYMLFVTGPYLLTQFTGNLNNFNVIFLLTQGQPQSMNLTGGAGYTDLLVTWLYKMTVQDTDYKMAAVIGIMVFLVTAVISLVVYNVLPSVKDEEGFQ
ncbi:MAG: sugar ABC transporter permease [Lachnospiraceae bacterium]|nr:sugar ABC transporter permease [Lachnospiraceae bacterium]